MSKALLEKFKAEHADIEALATRTMEAAEAEGRDLSEVEQRSLVEYRERINAIAAQVAPIVEFMQARNSAIDMTAVVARADRAEQVAVQRAEHRSLSSFVDSDQFRSYVGHGSSGRYDIEEFSARAAIVTGSGVGGTMLPNREKAYIPQPQAGTPLIDAMGYLPITQGSVDLVVYGDPKGATGFATVAEGSDKPEGAISASVVTVTVPTVAAWVQVSRQALADVPAMRAILEGQLRLGYAQKLESAAGAMVDALTPAKVTGDAGESLLVAARKGLAAVKSAGWNGNSLLTSPDNAAMFDIDLLGKTLSGAAVGQPVWGLNVIEVAGLTKSFVGDVRSALTFVERQGVQMYATDSHAGTFIANIITVLCEGRASSHATNLGALREVAAGAPAATSLTAAKAR